MHFGEDKRLLSDADGHTCVCVYGPLQQMCQWYCTYVCSFTALDPDLNDWPPVKNSEHHTSTKRKKAVVDEGTNEAVMPKSGWGVSKLTALERIGCVILRWKHGDQPKTKHGTRCTGRLIGKSARESAIKYEIARDELVADAAVRVCVNGSAVSCDEAMASPLTKLVDLCTFVCGLLAISVPVGVLIDMAVYLAHKLRS